MSKIWMSRLLILVLISLGGLIVYKNWPNEDINDINVNPDTIADQPVITNIPTPSQALKKNIVQPTLGENMAVMIIPKINKKLNINEGVRVQDIKDNPGHYPGTALPGDLGNFAVAGHRIWRIFRQINELKANDSIYIDYKGTRYTYKVYRSYVTSNTDWSAVNPDPGTANTPTRAVMTLTTCLLPPVGNKKRLIINAVLTNIK